MTQTDAGACSLVTLRPDGALDVFIFISTFQRGLQGHLGAAVTTEEVTIITFYFLSYLVVGLKPADVLFCVVLHLPALKMSH